MATVSLHLHTTACKKEQEPQFGLPEPRLRRGKCSSTHCSAQHSSTSRGQPPLQQRRPLLSAPICNEGFGSEPNLDQKMRSQHRAAFLLVGQSCVPGAPTCAERRLDVRCAAAQERVSTGQHRAAQRMLHTAASGLPAILVHLQKRERCHRSSSQSSGWWQQRWPCPALGVQQHQAEEHRAQTHRLAASWDKKQQLRHDLEQLAATRTPAVIHTELNPS